MLSYRTPGIYRKDILPKPSTELMTGVPAFLGFTGGGKIGVPQRLDLADQPAERFGEPLTDSYLAHAVRGFFENGGTRCYVVPIDEPSNTGSIVASMHAGLTALEPLDGLDLVCAPDIMRPRRKVGPRAEIGQLAYTSGEIAEVQADIMRHCLQMGDRFAILDALPGGSAKAVIEQRNCLAGADGALYYPWVSVRSFDKTRDEPDVVPPCGHVAGIYARADREVGVHKAPANFELEGVPDLEVVLDDQRQGELNPLGINALRAFPGRGIRVWGARTLGAGDWTYINVRRIFLTAARWVARNLAGAAFEPNNPGLWVRITRELNSYLGDLYRAGTLHGRTEAEAFFVKCDAETNPDEVREAGRLVAEIGLAAAAPNEHIVVRITRNAGDIALEMPT